MKSRRITTRPTLLIYAACCTLGIAFGCEDLGPRRRPPATIPGAETAATTPDAAQDDAARPPGRAATDPAAEAAGARSARTPPAPPPATTGPIRLSAGVALPQSLPTGTAMGFSVDYQFGEAGPQPSRQYVWVIRAANAARPRELPVQLSGRDTLQTLVPDLRPSDGPFETFIAEVQPDGRRQALSPVEPLKQDAW